MQYEYYSTPACCGKISHVFKLDRPLTKEIIKSLTDNGFTEHSFFTKAGILYVDNSDLILNGPLGTDRLQVKCKKNNCQKHMDIFKEILNKIE
jgi:hypothetical protein